MNKKAARQVCWALERRLPLPLAMAAGRPRDKVLGHLAFYEHKSDPMYLWRVSKFIFLQFLEGGGFVVYWKVNLSFPVQAVLRSLFQIADLETHFEYIVESVATPRRRRPFIAATPEGWAGPLPLCRRPQPTHPMLLPRPPPPSDAPSRTVTVASADDPFGVSFRRSRPPPLFCFNSFESLNY